MRTAGTAGKTGIFLLLVCVGLGWFLHGIFELGAQLKRQSGARRRRRASMPDRARRDILSLHHQR